MRFRSVLVAAFVLLAGACSKGAPDPSSAQLATVTQTTSSAPAAQPTALNGDGPPTTNGFYAAQHACPFEGCALRTWRAKEATTLLARPDLAAPVVATLIAGERVQAIDSVDYVVPEQGVVVDAIPAFQAGDVVYMLESEGEGVMHVWRRGDILEWTDEGDPDASDPRVISGIRWTLTPEARIAQYQAANARGGGWWVRLQRANHESGWVHDPKLECMSQIDPEEGC